MMESWVATYDIRDDARRQKLVGVLDGFGDRVQRSVFELCLREDDMESLQRKVKDVLDLDRDRLRLYPLCAECRDKVIDLGVTEGPPFDFPETIIV